MINSPLVSVRSDSFPPGKANEVKDEDCKVGHETKATTNRKPGPWSQREWFTSSALQQ